MKEKIEKSLRYSLKDGIFASVMTGFTQDYFTPFLLLLGGSARLVGVLSFLPNFFAALFLLKSADVTHKIGSRKKIINIFVFLQAFMLFPMALMALFKIKLPFFFIVLVTLFTAFGAFANPPWGSLMSDLVAEHKRGEYFGWRHRIFGCILISSTLLGGIILQVMNHVDVFYGFVLLFVGAFLARMVSWHFLGRMHDPRDQHKENEHFTLVRFLARMKESNFARFVLFVAFMSFSVNLAAPYFAVLMLRDLKFSYLLYSILNMTTQVTLYLMIGRWGKHADRVGNLKILRFTGPIIAILPLLWIFNRHPLFIFFAQIVSGFAWAGFNLCASNFIYDAVTPEKRTRCISYFNALNSFALCCGGLIGGLIVPLLPPLFGFKILTLFVLASSLRLVVSFWGPRTLKEVRKVEPVNDDELFFSMIGMKPILGLERFDS